MKNAWDWKTPCSHQDFLESPKEFKDFEITDAFLREVEDSIREAPEYYFWTHKRWKHRGKEPKNMKQTVQDQSQP